MGRLCLRGAEQGMERKGMGPDMDFLDGAVPAWRYVSAVCTMGGRVPGCQDARVSARMGWAVSITSDFRYRVPT